MPIFTFNKPAALFTSRPAALFTTKPVLGIDISADSICLIETSQNASQPEILSSKIIDCHQGSFLEQFESQRLQSVLLSAIKQCNISATQTYMTVPATKAIRKIVSLPKELQGDDLLQQLEVEAMQFMAKDNQAVNLDYVLLGSSAENQANNDILLVACRQVLINQYIHLCSNLGLKLVAVDIDSHMFELAYRQKNSVSNTTLLLCFRERSSQLLLLDQAKLQQLYHCNIGRHDLEVDDIALRLETHLQQQLRLLNTTLASIKQIALLGLQLSAEDNEQLNSVLPIPLDPVNVTFDTRLMVAYGLALKAHRYAAQNSIYSSVNKKVVSHVQY